MKKSVLSRILILVLLCLGFPKSARSQIYNYTGPGEHGYQEIGYGDYNNASDLFDMGNTTPWPYADGGLSFGPVYEILYYNPVANTLRCIGSASLSNLASASALIFQRGMTQPPTKHAPASTAPAGPAGTIPQTRAENNSVFPAGASKSERLSRHLMPLLDDNWNKPR
jgi:hypothetical protein